MTAEGVTLKLLASLRCVGGVGEECGWSLMIRSPPLMFVEPMTLPVRPMLELPPPLLIPRLVVTQHSSQQQACEIPAKHGLFTLPPPPPSPRTSCAIWLLVLELGFTFLNSLTGISRYHPMNLYFT